MDGLFAPGDTVQFGGAQFRRRGRIVPTFLASALDIVNRQNYSWAGVSFGAAAADRHIILLASSRRAGAPTFASASLGGVAATLVASSTTTNSLVGIFIAAVPSGTTGTVAINHNETNLVSCGYAVYSTYGLSSITPIDTANINDFPTLSDVLTAISGGPIFAVSQAPSGTATFTWDAPMVEGYEQGSAETHSHSGAAYSPILSGGPTVSVTPSTTGGVDGVLAAASFR